MRSIYTVKIKQKLYSTSTRNSVRLIKQQQLRLRNQCKLPLVENDETVVPWLCKRRYNSGYGRIYKFFHDLNLSCQI